MGDHVQPEAMGLPCASQQEARSPATTSSVIRAGPRGPVAAELPRYDQAKSVFPCRRSSGRDQRGTG